MLQQNHAGKKKSVFFSLDYCLKVSHLRPACGFKNNPTLSNAVISVSINAQTEMSVKRILVSRKSSMVLDLEEVYKQDNESSAHISCDSHSEIKSLIISLGKLLYIKKAETVNCTPLPFECQSTLTTEPVRPGPQRAAEFNQRFDFPLAAESNHRLRQTARSPLHLLQTALWQLNTQVRVLPLVSFWLANSVRLSCLIPHHVWVVGLALDAPCHVVSSGGIRNNKQTHQHRLKVQTAMLWMRSTQFPVQGLSSYFKRITHCKTWSIRNTRCIQRMAFTLKRQVWLHYAVD